MTSWLGFSGGSQASTTYHHPMQGATKLDSPQYQEPLFRKLQEPGVRKLELEITLMTKKARLRTMWKMMKMRRRWRMSRAECCHFLPRFLHSFPGFQILLTAVPTNCARRAYMQYDNNTNRYKEGPFFISPPPK